jgi:hypothetical protein
MSTAAQCCRHQRADRREDDGGIERLVRRLVRAAGPHGAERAGEILRSLVAAARDTMLQIGRELGHDACIDLAGRAKWTFHPSFERC